MTNGVGPRRGGRAGVLLLAGIAAAALATGCGSTKSSVSPAGVTATTAATTTTATTATTPAPSSPAAASKLQVIADPAGRLRYTTTALTAKAGKVTIEFANASPVAHNVTVGQGFKALGATPTFAGAKKALTLTLAPGTYAFWCSVPGHRAAGMEGVLTVG